MCLFPAFLVYLVFSRRRFFLSLSFSPASLTRSFPRNPSPRPGVKERATGNASGKRSGNKTEITFDWRSHAFNRLARVRTQTAGRSVFIRCRQRAFDRVSRDDRTFSLRTFPQLSTSVAHACLDKNECRVWAARYATGGFKLFADVSCNTKRGTFLAPLNNARARDNKFVRCSRGKKRHFD